jgi:putative DNA methylase
VVNRSASRTGGLRLWRNEDLVPSPGDVFQERLYCIRWIDAQGNKRYAAPDEADRAREAQVLSLLRERFAEWQREGFIPSKAIPQGGDKTEEPIRTRGWTHWHHLFTPRQLLTHGLIFKESSKGARSLQAAAMLSIGRLANWNSNPDEHLN